MTKAANPVSISDGKVILHRRGHAPLPVYQSDFNLRGALAAPNGKLIAVVEGTGSAGDWVFFLHRIDQADGPRYVKEPLAGAVDRFVDFLYKLDPKPKTKPDRLRLRPVTATPDRAFQFTLSGDNDLSDRTIPLVITEDGHAVLFEGCDQ